MTFLTLATSRPFHSLGNVFPGAAVPFGMAKIGIDLDGVYDPAGYTDQVSAVAPHLSREVVADPLFTLSPCFILCSSSTLPSVE